MSLRVDDVMVRDVITVECDLSIKKAAEVMNEFGMGCLIAVEGKKAVGIMTERDLLKRAVAQGKNVAKTRVKDIMSTPLIAVSPGTELGEAVELIFQMNIEKLPVV